MTKITSICENSDFSLFRDVPCMSTAKSLVLFNLQRREVAEVSRIDGNLRSGLRSLEERHFFETKPAMTPGERRNQLDIILIPTTRCNMECGYCYLGSRTGTVPNLKRWAALDFIDKIIERSSKRDVCINLFGGEPSLSSRLLRSIVEHVNELRSQLAGRHIYPGISTNGTMSRSLLNYLVDNHFYFSFSIDAPPSIQDVQRPFKAGRPSSHTVESNLLHLTKRTDKLRVRVTVTERSVSSMPDIVKYLADLGCKLIHFEPVNEYDRATEARREFRRPSPDTFSCHFIAALRTARRQGVSLATTCYHKLLFPSIHMCEGISGQRLALSPSGLVSHCAEVQYPDHPLAELMGAGHIGFDRKEVDLPQDFKNVKYLRAFSAQAASPQCTECFCRYICSNGCPSHNYQATGNPFVVDDFYCETTRAIVQHLLRSILAATKADKDAVYYDCDVTIWDIAIPPEYNIYDQGAYESSRN